MSLLLQLTQVGVAKLLAAKMGGPNVVLTTGKLGSAARAMTGIETALTTLICSSPITSSYLDVAAGRLDLNVMIDGAAAGLVADHIVREVGLFDQDGVLIFYWSTLASLGSITPVTAFSFSTSITLATANAAVIQIIDQGPPWGTLFEARLQTSERDTWRNLFLSF